MGLESATYINQLVSSNPTGSDGKAQGDDHLRLIKQVLQNSFPNLTGAVTMTQAQLNSLGSPGVINVPGMVMMWWGAEANIPLGWKLCNGVGNISNGSNVPDLRDKFVVGAGASYALAASGGSNTHIHTATTTVTVGGHVLTIPEIPSHTHTINKSSGSNNTPGAWLTTGTDGSATMQSQATGGGGAHDHPGSGSTTVAAADSRPPFVALFYIIKN